jgi:hypothetical protein
MAVRSAAQYGRMCGTQLKGALGAPELSSAGMEEVYGAAGRGEEWVGAGSTRRGTRRCPDGANQLRPQERRHVQAGKSRGRHQEQEAGRGRWRCSRCLVGSDEEGGLRCPWLSSNGPTRASNNGYGRSLDAGMQGKRLGGTGEEDAGHRRFGPLGVSSPQTMSL